MVFYFCLFSAKAVPSVDRSLKPRSELSASGLKKVVVPASLLNEFIILAHSNTDNNIETCGILAGNLVFYLLLVVCVCLCAVSAIEIGQLRN